MNAVVLVDQGVMCRTQEYQIRVCITLTYRHAWIAAWAIVFLGHNVSFVPDHDRRRRLASTSRRGRLHCQCQCTSRERALITGASPEELAVDVLDIGHSRCLTLYCPTACSLMWSPAPSR